MQVKSGSRVLIPLFCLLVPVQIWAQVSYSLTDFSPRELTMSVPDQHLQIMMTVSSTSDSLDLVRIVAPLSHTLSPQSGEYQASGGNPSSWTISISPSQDTVTYTPNVPILPGDMITFELTVADVAAQGSDAARTWSFEVRDHDETLWGIHTPATTDRALEILDIRFVPAGADDGSASAAQTLDSVLVQVTNHATVGVTLDPLDTRLFGNAFTHTGSENSMPTLSAGASDTVEVAYLAATVTSSPGWRNASATAANASVPVTRTYSEQLLVQDPGTLSIISVSTEPVTVSRGQDSISVDMEVRNTGEATVICDSSELRFLLNTQNRDSDYTVYVLSGVGSIPGGQTRTIGFGVDVHADAATGIVEVDGRVWGRDVNSGAETEDTTAATPDSFQVETAAELDVRTVLAYEDTVSRGQESLFVRTVVENIGQADAIRDASSLRFLANGGNVDGDYSTILLTPLAIIHGESTDTLEYLVNVDSLATLGSVALHARIFGRDANTLDTIVDTTAAQPDMWVVQDGAELVCSLWAAPDTVIIGQTISLFMQVRNTGGAAADSVTPHLPSMPISPR
ncbi:hypothetical protein AMJ40_01295 [candidate division TA06 bacterium DG_26]|uniref:Uncharacterized protein n=1 Tax=candidate division TA06 bacterium DG_26 TaxID=1703771 RepID=A0A0S7WLA2_UNCT6|nr:MAG: hypothetical protein AMJ40_01295 [candidate division TA06 bacterium DG_26]